MTMNHAFQGGPIGGPALPGVAQGQRWLG